MSPDESIAILTRLDDMHEELLEVKELAKATNGRVRGLEVWRAEIRGKLSVIVPSARISVVSFLAPIVAGVVTAAITAVLFAVLSH
jgi:hypothetical protein